MKIQEEKKVVRLKKPILACAVLLGATMGLQATPIQPCSTYTNYAQLQALGPTGGCTIADKTFSGFTYSMSSVGATPVTANEVTVTTIDNGPSAIGFLFGVALTAGPGQTNDIGIGYTVTGPDITDAAVTMAGGVIPPTNSSGAAAIAETICPGHVSAGCAHSLPLSVYNVNGATPKTSDEVTFKGVSTLGVLKDVDVFGGTGIASLSLFTDTVSQGDTVPEPGFYGLLAGGLGAIIMLARRRKKTV
jgi:hypothetical protein